MYWTIRIVLAYACLIPFFWIAINADKPKQEEVVEDLGEELAFEQQAQTVEVFSL